MASNLRMKWLVVLAFAALLALVAWWLVQGSNGFAPREDVVRTAPLPSLGPESPREDLAPISQRAAVASEPNAPRPEPTAAKPVPVDPTEAELDAFARECPPGMIEGLVLRGAVPVAGGRAWLGPEKSGGLPWGAAAEWESAPGVLRTEIGADGVFRFMSLAPDGYGVGVRTVDGATRRIWLELRPDTASRRILIVLGTGGIRGRVFDGDGGVCASWQVAINNWGRMPAGQQIVDGVTTDAQGTFEFAGLTGGSYILAACPIKDFRDPRKRTLFVELAAGEWKTVDIGTSAGAVWSGRLVTPRGEALVLSDFVRIEIETGGVLEQVVLSPEGKIRSLVGPGPHRLSLSVGLSWRMPVGDLVMPEHDLERDVAVSRCMLRVRATYYGTKFTPERAMSVLAPKLTLSPSGLRLDASRGADGHFYFFGIEPGEHALWCTPTPIDGAPAGKLPVRILPTDDQVELDVVVSDP